MDSKDKLQALYNYVKLTNPNEDISFLCNASVVLVLGSGADGYSAFFKIFCTNGNFVGYTYGSKPFCPLWLHDIFYVRRTPLDKVKDRLPDYEQKLATTRQCRRFYLLEPKEEGLFHDWYR